MSSYQEPAGIKSQPVARSICSSFLLVVVVLGVVVAFGSETKPDELILCNPLSVWDWIPVA